MSDSKSARQNSLDACLGLAFGAEQDTTAEMATKSVLQSLGHLMKTVPQVLLRDSADGEATEPCVVPSTSQSYGTASTSRYRIDGQIAEGGMGKILKGRDTDLGRDLAVKVLLDKHVDKPEVIQRFVEEAQIGGQLQHPGIAPVYELGQFEDQRPFFTMKLVKGKTLAELLESRADVESDRAHYLGIFEQICQTMAYAHSRGVIHRDLKPANIMVGAFGEVQVMDWGLAKVLSAGGVADEKKAHQTHQDRSIIETLRSAGSNTPAEFGSQTQMGSVMGTPAYMPPEQALGEIDRLDQRADVFGLGAILCEILTGKPPYVGADHVQIYRLATRGKLEDCYRRIDESHVDAELTKVLKECLAAEPIDRPRSASVLATRISQYRAGVETRLRKSEIDHATETARADEERKRRRISMALAASILALVTALTGSGFWMQTQKAVAAENERQKTVEQKEELRWILYQSDLQRAQMEIERGNYEAAKKTLLAHVPDGDQEDFRSFEWHYLARQCPAAIRDASSKWDDDMVSWIQSGHRFGRTAYSLDKSRVASYDDSLKQLVVWNTRTGKRIWSKQLNLQVEYPDSRLSPDGRLLAFVTASVGEGNELNSAATEIHIWDIDADKKVATVTPSDIPAMEEKTATVEFKPNSNAIAIIIKNKSYLGDNERFSRNLFLWDFQDNTLLFETHLERPHFASDGFSFSQDGALIAIPSRPGRENFDRTAKSQRDAVGVVHLIDAESGEKVRDLFAIPYRFGHKPTFSDDGSRLAMSCTNRSQFFNKSYEKDDTLLIWEVASGTLTTVASSKAGRSEIEFNSTGDLVLLCPNQPGANAELFQVSDGSLAFRLENQFGNPIRFSDDDQFLETSDHQGVRWRWSVPRPPFNDSERIPYGNVALSGDGKRFLKQSWIGEDRETAHIFSTRGPLLQSTKIPWNQMWHPKNLNFDGSILAIEHSDRKTEPPIRQISLWDIENRKPIGHVFSSNEREQRKHLWRMSPTDSKMMGIISITTDDEASPTRDQLRIWDQQTLAEQRIELDGEVTTAKYSVDGKWIGVFTTPWKDGGTTETNGVVESKAEDGTLKLYDANDGSIVKTLKVAGEFSALAISPDGQYVAGMNEGLAQHRIEVWDLESREIHSIMDGTSNQILFSPDGKRVISKRVKKEAGQNILELIVWDMNSGQQLLGIPNYGTGAEAWTTMSFLPGQHRIFDRSLRGPPHIWDGTPVDLSQE